MVALLGGAERPTRANWRAAAIVGLGLLLGGNGLLVWSESRIPSGVAALLVGVVPCCMVLIDWLRPHGTRPGAQVVLGLVLGLAGLLFLVGPSSAAGGGRDRPRRVPLRCWSARFSWAAGRSTLATARCRARRSSRPRCRCWRRFCADDRRRAHGELAALDPRFSLRSIARVAYLVVFGSIVAFTAYVWLLRVSTPARVSTYAYVNPIVAVLLGWAFAGEALTARMMVAAAVIVSGVALITLAPRAATQQ